MVRVWAVVLWEIKFYPWRGTMTRGWSVLDFGIIAKASHCFGVVVDSVDFFCDASVHPEVGCADPGCRVREVDAGMVSLVDHTVSMA